MAIFIPGYLASATIGANDLSGITASGTLTLTKNVLTKSVAGAKSPNIIAGQRTGTLNLTGHLGVDELALLNGAWESDAVLTFEFQVGEATAATDAGKYSGNALVETFTPSFSADGEWDFSLDLITDGDVVYTPPV